MNLLKGKPVTASTALVERLTKAGINAQDVGRGRVLFADENNYQAVNFAFLDKLTRTLQKTPFRIDEVQAEKGRGLIITFVSV